LEKSSSKTVIFGMAHGGDYQAIEQSFCIIGRKSSIKAEMYNEKMTCNGPVS